MLEKLQAKYRHMIISALAGFAGGVLAPVLHAVVSAKGISGVDWPVTLKAALDAGVLGSLAMFGLLNGTKLTNQYGAGKDK
jgi:hypothetical protein